MRLGVYSDFSYRQSEGALYTDQAFAVFLAGLAESVDELVLIGRLDPNSAPWHYRLPARVRLVALPYYAALSRPLAVSVALARSLRRFSRLLGSLDVVWLLGPHPLSIVFAGMAALRRRRVVLGVRQDLPRYVRSRHPGRRWLWMLAHALEGLFRLMARRMPVIVVGDDLARNYAPAPQRLTVTISLVRGSDLAVSLSAGERSYDGQLQVLSVGRLEEEKNPLLLADVLAGLAERDPRWRLVVCGEGPLREPLLRRLVQLGVEHRAKVLGYIPFDRGLLDLYRTSHALLHVAWTEGVPQVILEAFATGLPVVATSVGGVPDVVDGCALLVPPGDAAAATQALIRVGADPQLRSACVRGGLELSRRHTLEAQRDRVIGFLRGDDVAATVPADAR